MKKNRNEESNQASYYDSEKNTEAKKRSREKKKKEHGKDTSIYLDKNAEKWLNHIASKYFGVDLESNGRDKKVNRSNVIKELIYHFILHVGIYKGKDKRDFEWLKKDINEYLEFLRSTDNKEGKVLNVIDEKRKASYIHKKLMKRIKKMVIKKRVQ